MARTGYQLDSAAFRELLLNSPWMVAEMDSRAEAAQALFEAIAPVGDVVIEDDDHPGRFKESTVVISGTNGGVHHDRAFGRLASIDPLALAKEFGHVAVNGRFVEGSHALVRSMDAFGGQFGSSAVGKFGGRGAAVQKKRAATAKRRESARARLAAESPAARTLRLAKAARTRAAKKRAPALEAIKQARRAKRKRR